MGFSNKRDKFVPVHLVCFRDMIRADDTASPDYDAAGKTILSIARVIQFMEDVACAVRARWCNRKGEV